MNYYEAAKIRKTGLSELVTNRLVGGQGVFSSVRGAMSERSQAKSLAFKEKFDPLNIVKFLTGGSNIAPAVLGRILGRSQADISYFTGKKQPSRGASYARILGNVPRGQDSPKAVRTLNKMFDFMQMTRQDDERERQTRLSFEDDRNDMISFQHNEVLSILAEATKNKRKAEREMRKEAAKRNKEFERRQKDLQKREQELAQRQTTATKETKEVAPKTEEEARKELPELPERPKQTPRLFETKPSATPAPPAPSPAGAASRVMEAAKKAATATRAATPVILGGTGVSILGEAIAKGESAAGSYNAANMGTKNNRIVPVKGKVDLENMTVGEVMRRQNIKWGSPNESEKLFAVGKYQMIPETLADGIKSLGNVSMNDKFNGALQERLFNEYLLGRKRPAINKYLMNPTDDPALLYKALKQLSLEWASFADPDKPGGKTSAYGSGNKASVSVDQATDLLKKERARLAPVRNTQQVPVQQKDINQMSVEAADAKKDLVSSSTGSITVVNTKTEVKNTTRVNETTENNTNPILKQK